MKNKKQDKTLDNYNYCMITMFIILTEVLIVMKRAMGLIIGAKLVLTIATLPISIDIPYAFTTLFAIYTVIFILMTFSEAMLNQLIIATYHQQGDETFEK